LFTIIAMLRMQRGGAPTSLFLARSQTKQLASLNLLSGIGLLAAVGCLLIWPRLESVLLGIAAGELLSFFVFFLLATKSLRRALSDVATAIVVPVVMVA